MKYPLNQIKQEIANNLNQYLKDKKIDINVKLEIPPDKKMGDFSFPCFNLAPLLKKPPNEIATDISNNINRSAWIKKRVVKGGYVNFYINYDKLVKEVIDSFISKKIEYGFLEKKGKKVIIEHTSANPNGPLHVGRARNPIIGDTLVRIYKAAGYDVESQFYLDDMGKQVAILTWGINNLEKKQIPLSNYNKPDHQYVGYYQIANKLMKENDKISKEINNIIQKSEIGDKETIKEIHKSYTPVLKGINESLAKINIEIDSYIPESKFVKDNTVEKVIEKLKNSKYSKLEDNAFYIDLEQFGVKGRNTRFFFLRSDGTTLYATRDIAYHLWKAKNADVLINILGEDHKLESKQVEIGLKLLDAKIIPKAIFYSFVSLPGGKMSTRAGRVVYLDDLIDECIKRAYVEVKKRRGEELSQEKQKQIAETIGTAALRYNIIKVQPEKDIVFKWEEALNFEGNSAPFVQYSHARACSILKKNTEDFKDFDYLLLNHPSELSLIFKIAEFPITIEEASINFKPHLIANYLFELASSFNQFYRDCPVLIEKNIKLRNARLYLVEISRNVLKNGLNLIGITAPEEM